MSFLHPSDYIHCYCIDHVPIHLCIARFLYYQILVHIPIFQKLHSALHVDFEFHLNSHSSQYQKDVPINQATNNHDPASTVACIFRTHSFTTLLLFFKAICLKVPFHYFPTPVFLHPFHTHPSRFLPHSCFRNRCFQRTPDMNPLQTHL